MTPSDHDLLRDFASGSQPAFAALVARHLDLVYSAARRQVRSPALAEEVAQAVFTDLTHAAAGWRGDVPLPEWLYTATRRTAVEVIRREVRRQARETAAAETAVAESDAPDWLPIEPLLDEAMDTLDPVDRGAIVLRFFENQNLRDIAVLLGISEDAAQKRVAHAVDRLRMFFAERGVTVGAASLGAALSAHAVQSAPVGLAAAITTAGGSAAAAGVAPAVSAPSAKTFARTALIAVAAVIVAAVVYALYEAQVIREQREQIVVLEQQVSRSEAEREDVTRQLAAARRELQASDAVLAKADEALAAAARRETSGELELKRELETWAAEVRALKTWAERVPTGTIPEMRFLTDRDWYVVARDHPIETERDARLALAALRQEAKRRFLPMMNAAVEKYRDAHAGQAPTDVFLLTPYFAEPIEPEILERYYVVPPTVEDERMKSWLIAEKELVDEEYDARFYVQRGGGVGSTGAGQAADLIREAMAAYRREHDGRGPENLELLRPYFETPADADAALKDLEPPGGG